MGVQILALFVARLLQQRGLSEQYFRHTLWQVLGSFDFLRVWATEGCVRARQRLSHAADVPHPRLHQIAQYARGNLFHIGTGQPNKFGASVQRG